MENTENKANNTNNTNNSDSGCFGCLVCIAVFLIAVLFLASCFHEKEEEDTSIDDTLGYTHSAEYNDNYTYDSSIDTSGTSDIGIEEDNTSTDDTSTDTEESYLFEIQRDIEGALYSIDEIDFTGNTVVNSVTVNENAGTENTDDVIVLVNLTWYTKNREDQTRKVIEILSNRIARKLENHLPNESELTLFWDADFTGLSIKHSFYKRDNEMYIYNN